MTADPRAKELRQELLDAVEARGEASRYLQRARSINIGPFGGMKVREAEAELQAASKRVTEAFENWNEVIRESSEEEQLEEALKREEEP